MFEPLLSLNPQFAWMAAAAMDDGDVGGAPWAKPRQNNQKLQIKLNHPNIVHFFLQISL